jgi:hypothetical protein
MKIELSRRQEIIISFVLAAVFGFIWGSMFPGGSSYGPELSLGRNDLNVEHGQVISAQSMKVEKPTSYVFPPPLFVFEWFEFEVNVHNASGGVLRINFTRNGNVLRTDLVVGSQRIVVEGYGGYRFHDSEVDVLLQALDENVQVEYIYIAVERGSKQYNPLVTATGYVILVAIVIFVWTYHSKRESSSCPE